MSNRSPVLYRRPSLRLGSSSRASLYTCRMSHYLLEASKGCQGYSELYLLEMSQAVLLALRTPGGYRSPRLM